MTEMLPASEVIRRVALKILANHPEGLRPSALKTLAENELGQYIEKDGQNKGKYRSAIWDLDKRFPEYVRKETISNKKALFKPSDKLIASANNIDIPSNLEQYKTIYRIEVSQFKLETIKQILPRLNSSERLNTEEIYFHIIKGKLKQVSKLVDELEVIPLIEYALNDKDVSKETKDNFNEIKVLLKLLERRSSNRW